MITYVEISLFDSPAQTLINTVNTVGVMGKGIAASFKKIYPEMYKEYRRLCLDGKLSIGTLYIYRTPNKIIVNFPTKKNWRYPSRAEYIVEGLEKFVAIYNDFGISSASFPQLGCGHGELDWEHQVRPVMEKYLKDLPIPIYIHLYKKSYDFIPERFDKNYRRQAIVERQRISSDQLWDDLKNLVTGDDHQIYQASLFNPKIYVNDDYIQVSHVNGEPLIIYREDLEDLWDMLRIRGTIQEIDIPEAIRQSGASDWLLEFLSQLNYIKPIQLRSHGKMKFVRGLQYTPKPELTVERNLDVVV